MPVRLPKGAAILTVNAPVQTVSEMNRRDHWAVRNKRRQKQRREVYYAWKIAAATNRKRLVLPLTVRLTRIGAKVLDGDNLQASFKFVRDQVAEMLGIDDGDSGISFEYEQTVAKHYGIIIEVFARG